MSNCTTSKMHSSYFGVPDSFIDNIWPYLSWKSKDGIMVLKNLSFILLQQSYFWVLTLMLACKRTSFYFDGCFEFWILANSRSGFHLSFLQSQNVWSP